jgi:dienelactone hydrolase
MNGINRFSVSLILIFFSLTLISCQADRESNLILVYTKANGKSKKIRNAATWQKRYEQILDSMQVVMGPLPDRTSKTDLNLLFLEDTLINSIRRIKLTYEAENNDRVPAYLLIPEKNLKPVPGILCLHQTIQIGKGEPAGIGGSPNLDYAWELAERGYVTIAPDYPNFGDYIYDPYQNGYISATMKAIRNHMAAIDLLQALPQVDPERIACIGHSLGGHNSLFVTAFDKRIKAVVTSCGFTSFIKYYGGDLKGWSHKGYMPLISSKYNSDPEKMPFDFPEIIAAIAPRPIFINAPLHDSNFDVTGVYDCVETALPVYELFGAGENIIMKNPDAPHDFPPAEREEAYQFLDRELSIKRK